MAGKSDKYMYVLLGSMAGLPFGFFLWIGTLDPKSRRGVECLNQVFGRFGLGPVNFDTWTAAIVIVGGLMVTCGWVLARSRSWFSLLTHGILSITGIMGWMIGSHAGIAGAIFLSLVCLAGTWLYFRRAGLLKESHYSD